MPDLPRPSPIKALHAGLRRLRQFAWVELGDLDPMTDGGLAHAHIRIRGGLIQGRNVLARVPLWSQYGLSPAENLAYQAACFARAAPSGRTPVLHATLPPGPGLPFGALIVDEIRGRPVRLPGDLAALADCLACLHRLPVPPPAERPPLADQADPVRATLAIIEGQARSLDAVSIHADTRRQIDEELDWARAFAARTDRPPHPITLVGTDTHPGNYLIAADGRAILHDLEKALYGSPSIDLAHCTLPTSTLWHRASPCTLAPAEIIAFYRSYLGAIPGPLAEGLAPWLLPMRRFTWLRTITWCAKWRAERGQTAGSDGAGADAARLIALFFQPDEMRAQRREWLASEPLPLEDLVRS